MHSKMTTLGKVFDTVDQMSVNNHDKFINVRELFFESLESIKISGEPHHLKPIAQQAICTKLGIPATYLRKCPTHLQERNLNHWIQKLKNDELFFRFDGEDVRAIFTKKYRPVDNFEVLEKLDRLGFDSDQQVQVSLDENFMMLNILDGHRIFSLDGNKDKMTPGINLSNSEVGLSALSISSYFFRIVCCNGLISKTEVSASYRHVSLKILSELPQTLNKLQYELDRQKDKFRISLESRVSNFDETLSRFNRQFLLSKQEISAVEWAVFGAGSIETIWDVINVYTKSAQHKELS
ncbi:MAG: hypothetical protein QG641_2258, partial [Candidatus Poribacteria bacterium]|nr:hypothetical protein [Candidatus Poribacteria bacterium]